MRENPYKFGYYLMLSIVIIQIAATFYVSKRMRTRKELPSFFRIDSATVVITPEEIKTISHNPYNPTMLYGFVYKDTVYINFISDDDKSENTRLTKNICGSTDYTFHLR